MPAPTPSPTRTRTRLSPSGNSCEYSAKAATCESLATWTGRPNRTPRRLASGTSSQSRWEALLTVPAESTTPGVATPTPITSDGACATSRSASRPTHPMRRRPSAGQCPSTRCPIAPCRSAIAPVKGTVLNRGRRCFGSLAPAKPAWAASLRRRRRSPVRPQVHHREADRPSRRPLPSPVAVSRAISARLVGPLR